MKKLIVIIFSFLTLTACSSVQQKSHTIEYYLGCVDGQTVLYGGGNVIKVTNENGYIKRCGIVI